MKKFTIQVEVDEFELRYNYEKEDDRSIEDLISAEMGWVQESGIYVISIKEKK